MNVLLIDSGNSRLKCCIATPEHLLAQMTLETPLLLTLNPEQLNTLLTEKISAFNAKHLSATQRISQCIVASVTPTLDATLHAVLATLLQCPVHFVPHNIPVPLENMYDDPDQLGIDRLVACYGATKIYPYSAQIVISFGTAITIDCVHDGTFHGGLITTGLHTAYDSLLSKTSKLPVQVLELENVRKMPFIGTNTKQCLQSGFIHGFIGMIESLIYKTAISMQQQFQLTEAPVVIASGGTAQFFAQHVQTITFTNEHLVLDGLRFLVPQPQAG